MVSLLVDNILFQKLKIIESDSQNLIRIFKSQICQLKWDAHIDQIFWMFTVKLLDICYVFFFVV